MNHEIRGRSSLLGCWNTLFGDNLLLPVISLYKCASSKVLTVFLTLGPLKPKAWLAELCNSCQDDPPPLPASPYLCLHSYTCLIIKLDLITACESTTLIFLLEPDVLVLRLDSQSVGMWYWFVHDSLQMHGYLSDQRGKVVEKDDQNSGVLIKQNRK